MSSSTQIDTRAAIRDFLSRFVSIDELGDDADIFASGLVNSLFAMQIIQFIEHQFAFSIENEDLEPDNFNTVRGMVAFVERKLAASGGGST